MATKKISELEAINAAEDNDVLVIVDTSESTTNKITKGNLLIGAGHTIEMTLNENYQIVLVLKNAAGTALSTQTIDLPNENAVTNLAYNNGVLTITKQSGATSQINLTGLIEGLVTESDFNTFKEALQTTLEAINEKDAEQDEAISENYKVINKLNEKLENQQKVIDQLPQVTGQGTEVTLQDTIAAQFTIFDEEGNSTQESTKGYQLLSYLTKGTKSYGGINLKIDENGYLYITGSNTYTSYITLLSFTMVANQAYTIDETGCTNDLKISWANVNTFTSDAHRTYTPTADTETAIQLIIPANTNYNNYKMKIFLYEGSYDSGKKLEPYTGGIASPNPNYEQPIYSAGDNENLFDTSLLPITKNGVTISKDSKGNVVLNGTPTITSGYINFIVSSKKQLSAGTYTASFEQKKVGIGSVIVGWGNAYLNLTLDETINKKTATINDNGEAQFNINVRYDVGTLDNFILNPKLEKGNKASGYSSYGMGSINEKIQTRNLFDLNGEILYASNTNYIINNNQLKVPSSSGASGYLLYKKVYKSGTYHFSSKLLNGSSKRYVIRIFDKENNVVSDLTISGWSYNAYYKAYYKDSDGSFTIPSGYTFIVGFVYLDCTLGEIQIEPGSTATPYVPHEEQDYSIFVQQPMRSIGDVRDCFVKVDGNWYERHYIGEVVLNGTEYWELLNSTSDYYEFITYNSLKPVAPSSYTFPMASHFGNATNNRCVANGNQLLIRVPASMNITNATEFKNWLQENNVTINYLLAEPLDLPCTEIQIQQLENKPSTYKDFTIIQSEDETPAYLEVSGIRDINTMFDKVTNAIVSLGGNV